MVESGEQDMISSSPAEKDASAGLLAVYNRAKHSEAATEENPGFTISTLELSEEDLGVLSIEQCADLAKTKSKMKASPPIATKPFIPGLALHINHDCPVTLEDCYTSWKAIQRKHYTEPLSPKTKDKSLWAEESRPYILPFYFLYQLYPFPRALPLAMATPLAHIYRRTPSFKLLFFPRGVSKQIHIGLSWVPPFPNKKGFLATANLFFKLRFPELMDHISPLILTTPSIWIVGMLKHKKNMYHQIFGGVLYGHSIVEERTAFIYYVAIREPGSEHHKGEFDVVISTGEYDFHATTDELVEYTTMMNEILLQMNSDYIRSDTSCAGIGSRRLGLSLLNTVQILLFRVITEGDEVTSSLVEGKCDLYLQATVGTFAYDRLLLVGFQYSILHHTICDDKMINPWYPRSVGHKSELPPKLHFTVTGNLPPGNAKCRLLVLKHPLALLFPPHVHLGAPQHLQTENKKTYFSQWRLRTGLPTPPEHTSCNFSPSDKKPSTIGCIKKNWDIMDAEPCKSGSVIDWQFVNDTDILGKALNVRVCEASHEMDLEESLRPTGDFWACAYNAIYGNTMPWCNYREFKSRVLSQLLKYPYIHPRNPLRLEPDMNLVQGLIEAEIREENQYEGPITDDEIRALWNYEMTDGNIPTTFATQMVNSHFLHPSLPTKETHLLIFTVKWGHPPGGEEEYKLELMSPSMETVLKHEQEEKAQYYAMAMYEKPDVLDVHGGCISFTVVYINIWVSNLFRSCDLEQMRGR